MKLGQASEWPVCDAKWADRQYEIAYDCYFAGDWLAAEKHLRNAIEVSPFDSRFRLLLAQVYCARGWLSMSFSELESLKNIDPHNEGAKGLDQLLKGKMSEQKCNRQRRIRTASGWKSMLHLPFAWFH